MIFDKSVDLVNADKLWIWFEWFLEKSWLEEFFRWDREGYMCWFNVRDLWDLEFERWLKMYFIYFFYLLFSSLSPNYFDPQLLDTLWRDWLWCFFLKSFSISEAVFPLFVELVRIKLDEYFLFMSPSFFILE